MKIKTYLKTRLAFGLFVWIVLGYGVAAMVFEGGTGEPNDPYRIATAEQLISFGQDPTLLSRHFVLVADIDLDPWLPGGREFSEAVIAPFSSARFAGSFDGNGHVVHNLVIADVNDYAGLFGYVAPGGIVKNLGLENVNVSGQSNVGALVGLNEGTLSSCHSAGSVNGWPSVSGSDYHFNVGGLVGKNSGTVTECTTAGTVTGSMSVGGLVGSNSGTVYSCHSTADVTGIGSSLPDDIVATGSSVGGLVGSNRGGNITSCSSAGSITGGGPNVGGLVGYNNTGTVSSCHSTGDVTGMDSDVGGLAGQNIPMSTLVLCFSTGHVTGMGESVGGLVGSNSGTVSSCCSYGDVYSNYVSDGPLDYAEVGGLAGVNSGSISTCCSTGDVSSIDYGVGGLAGINYGTVDSCYSTGRAEGADMVGGLAGGSSFGQILSSYFLAEPDGGGPDNGLGKALTAGQMRQMESFVGFDFWGSRADGLRDDWFMPQDSLPVLVWQTEVTGLKTVPDLRRMTLEEARGVLEQAGLVLAAEVRTDYDRTMPQGLVLGAYYPRSYAAPGGTVEVVVSKGPYDWSSNPGNGIAARPFQIQTASQLDSLTDHPELWSKSFLLTTDIDMAGRQYSKALIAPDVNDTTEGFQGTAFTGSFDGRGSKILDLNIATKTNDYLGLFGYIAKGATVRKVNLVTARIHGERGSDYVGTMAGYNAGTVTDCSATGAVSGHSGFIGNLVGGNEGVIENAYTRVSRLGYYS